MLISPGAYGTGIQIACEWRFARHIDGARWRTPAVFRTGRTFYDFDLFRVVGITREVAELTHAVNENTAGCIETAHEDVALGTAVATFPK
ncbi:hypothetical protein D3C81_1799240 [compost metagenome]